MRSSLPEADAVADSAEQMTSDIDQPLVDSMVEVLAHNAKSHDLEIALIR